MAATDTLIVIPAYNEAAQIKEVVSAVRRQTGADVLVIDDCSTDDTAGLAREAGAMVVRHPINLRYGAAVQTGIRAAWRGGYKFLGVMDGDGQHEVACLERILAPVRDDKADYVLGSRFLPGPDIPRYRSLPVRRVGSWALSILVRMFTGLRITDPTSGFLAMDRSAMEILASDVYPHDYPDADVIILLHRRGLRVVEVAVTMYRSYGKSMHSGVIKPFYYAYKMGLSILLTLLRT